jgi:acetyl-CoA decarbonylase/synthase, CODH/ACS complex subunit delta
MAVDLVKEKYSNSINELEIGRGQNAIKVGGEGALPFLFDEGAMPHAPVVAMEVLDCEPTDWPEHVRGALGPVVSDPASWAKEAITRFGAKAIVLRLASAHPDYGKRSHDKIASDVKAVSQSVNAPLIVIGCGDDEIDNELMHKVSQALKGENSLLGIAAQNNYKTLAATALADGHSVIAESPIDINIAKQVNILISDMGLDSKRIVMHPTTTSLGYGMEYVYSIMERGRLAAFIGDKMLSMPFILFVGQEVWKTKEAKESAAQGVNWEIATAVLMLQAGADILVMRHPGAISTVAKYIDTLMQKG